ncbi:DNA glycosylase AlkZ-like family protein [Vulgatibacter sp.]|uniref:DNA glycosylase AlkZ-like family protein n=1 Tax=Vulgatibacter sp. TaxID=1971226 RepID=UPI0035666A96
MSRRDEATLCPRALNRALLELTIRNLLPLVQIPPRGLWRTSGQPVLATAQQWLGKPLARRPSLQALIRRYLAAFGPATSAPVRLVAPFDNLVLSHADRGRIVPEPLRRTIFSSKNGQIPGTVLLDGFVAGTWRLEQQRQRAVLQLELLRRPSRQERTALRDEGERLLLFAAPEAAHRELLF